MKKEMCNNKNNGRQRLQHWMWTALMLICCAITVLCSGCIDNNPYTTEVTVFVEELPASLAAILFAIDSYTLEWRDGAGTRRTRSIQSIDDLPNIDISLYKPSVITLTPLHSSGRRFPPAGIYLNNPTQLHKLVTLSWKDGCAIAYLQELSYRLVDFEIFNGKRFLYEVATRSGGRSCLIESKTVIAKVATYAMRATYIVLQQHHTHRVVIPSGTWYFLDYSLQPLQVEQSESAIEISLPIGTYVLIHPTGKQLTLTVTDMEAYVY